MFDLKKPAARPLAAAVVAVSLIFLAWFWWLAVGSDRIDFLNHRAPVEWIVYPKPPEGLLHKSAGLETVFRQSFTLNSVPAKADLSVRGMKHWTVAVNGVAVEPPTAAGGNWKQPATFDVSRQLHAGTNEITATVRHTNGPPALWLALDLGGQKIVSGTDWEASLTGAAWRKAALASAPMAPAKGSVLFGGERPLDCLIRRLPVLLVFGVFAAGLLFRGRWWLKGYQERGEPWGPVHSRKFAAIALAVPALLWAVLFFNNLTLLPYIAGFDSVDHLDYIDHLKMHWRLPLATDGWQMYQPPLYYFVSALLLAPVQTVGFNPHSIDLLRILGLGIGVTHFSIVFLGLRLLFPRRLGVQLFGLVLAAFVPENLYLAHYPTNESLAATLTTGAIYFCLRILKDDRDSPWLFAALGLCLGAALLTKVTGLIAVPFIGAVLAARLVLKRQLQPFVWLKTWVLGAVTTIAVCGWHYMRVWRHLGSPLVGNWDAAAGFHWWMEPGFHTPAFFLRFGRCLAYPWHAGFDGFADGLYSTLWGDGLWGGMVKISDRPPWNYELMAAGFILALLPTLLILAGVVIALRRFIRQPDLSWLLLLGVAFGTLAALIFMSLKLPNAGQVKSFYGLIALLPLCAFGALGWEKLLQRGKMIATVASVLIGVWAINSYASFWIRDWEPETQVAVGRILSRDHFLAEAAPHYAEALRRDPRNVRARIAMAMDLVLQKQIEPAKELLDQVIRDAPDDADARFTLVMLLMQQNQFPTAEAEARRVIGLAPDHPLGLMSLCDALAKQGRYEEALAAGRESLRVNALSPEMQFLFGEICSQLGRGTEAAAHFRLAAELKPEWAEARRRAGEPSSAPKQ